MSQRVSLDERIVDELQELAQLYLQSGRLDRAAEILWTVQQVEQRIALAKADRNAERAG